MINKQTKQDLIANIKDKDEKMKIANIIDKCNKAQAMDKVTATSFLDLSQKDKVISLLNREKVKYELYYPNEYCEKGIIFFLPDYAEKVEYDNYISCIKIVAKDMNKLKHKDFMGSIYAMGIKNDFIGDIFVTVNAAYVYILKEVENFLLDNLFKVGNQEVELSIIDLNSLESKELKVEYIEKTYIIPSRRIDALLSEVYNLSRKETKEKIVAGDLYVNAAECINPSIEFYEGDIVSFRRCGKLKVGQEIRTTKSGNICINIYRYK